MATGNRRYRQDFCTPRIVGGANPGPPQAPTYVDEATGDADFEDHFVIETTTTLPVTFDWATECTVLEILVEKATDSLFIAKGNHVAATVGAYDHWHPGGGSLVRPSAPFRQLTITTADGAATDGRVEIHVYAGRLAVLAAGAG